MDTPRESDEQRWEAGWEGHTQAQRERFARLPFSEKLRWLEEAHQLVLRLEEARRRATGAPETPRDGET